MCTILKLNYSKGFKAFYMIPKTAKTVPFRALQSAKKPSFLYLAAGLRL